LEAERVGWEAVNRHGEDTIYVGGGAQHGTFEEDNGKREPFAIIDILYFALYNNWMVLMWWQCIKSEYRGGIHKISFPIMYQGINKEYGGGVRSFSLGMSAPPKAYKEKNK